jgi:hypothetical protein
MAELTREELIRFIKENSKAFSDFKYFSILENDELLTIKKEIEESLSSNKSLKGNKPPER